jgi:hypothetical protein
MSGDEGVIERIISENLGVYRASASRLQEDVSQEAQVASDYRGRLVYELLQNADDAMADAETSNDRVSFLVTDGELWIANTGRALTDGDVFGLCGLGASSKVDAGGNRRASIGHKGLGFKSVLEITAAPTVYSRTTSFTLGTHNAMPLVSALWAERSLPPPRAVPAMRFPASVVSVPARWRDYQASGFNTAFRFPFRDSLDAAHRAAVAEILLGLPLTTVLFLKHLEHIDVRIEQDSRVIERAWTVRRERLDTQRGEWIEAHGFGGSGTYRVIVSDSDQTATFLVAHDADVAIGEHRVGLSGPAWDGVDLTEVSVAALAPGGATLPDEWRRFHVFLPTAEVCPYPILINGAFATDLSRRHVGVTDEPRDYNAHLIRQAARVIVSQLVPLLRRVGVDAVLEVLDRGGASEADGAAGLLHGALVEELAPVPLVPSEGETELRLPEIVLPASVLGPDGRHFREVLRHDATWDGLEFPAAPYCVGRWARIAADHGARELSASDTLGAMARCHDPLRASAVDHESGGFELDPLLELSAALWTRSSVGDRDELETRARDEPLFPVEARSNRTLDRVVLGSTPAFFPPQPARTAVALPDLRFMAHALCWGALTSNKERTELLADRMNVWTSLFGVREFRFETVVQTAVLPALVLSPGPQARELLARLSTDDALGTICQLAGRAAKPDRPLRYQRLQSDRALFNLSRLPVPCRSQDGAERWLPAYRVYFGEDWLGEESVELVHRTLPDDSGATFDYLAPPERLLGLLGDYPTDADADVDDDSDGEVDADENADEAIESSERDRWVAFLTWIGVNQVLRPIHFHDVEDDGTTWLTTKDFGRPGGWAFTGLAETWDTFAASLRDWIKARHDLSEMTPYLYEVHDLDQIEVIAEAARRDETATVAQTFCAHLVRHWARLAPLAECQVALVPHGKWPGARNIKRALPEELADGGENLWVHRLRSRSIAPTRLGPRQPGQTWRPTRELERRFTGRGRSAATLLPILDLPAELPEGPVRSVADRLGIRGEPSPSTFTNDDALRLCAQLRRRFVDTISPSNLRDGIKPVYRQMFELLSGHATDAAYQLRTAPLLANTPEGLRFLPATEMLYASTPGIRERSGVAGAVSTYVLEAEAAATGPLRNLFAMRTLEDALEWRPQPGEASLDPEGVSAMRAELAQLVPSLLARIRTERNNQTDAGVLREFVERVEPVESLELSCSLDGEPIAGVAARPYYVQLAKGSSPFQAFVVWETPDAWPPGPEAAQGLAMALADALGINLVETFLAFIQSDDGQRRRLLDIAGAAGLLEEINAELADGTPAESEPMPEPKPTEGEDDATGDKPAGTPPKPVPAAPRVPLLRFEDLTIDGTPALIAGIRDSGANGPGAGGVGGAGNSPNGKGRAPIGTDLNALDALGMRITIAYELLRLRRAGHADASDDPQDGSRSVVVDVHTPAMIRSAEEVSAVVAAVLDDLETDGISRLYPGFDILTIADGKPNRLIELKSSGVDARVQTMSWNEWKTARISAMRAAFWLYLVGNLRADLPHATPYIRAINDPFGTITADEITDQQLRRAVQLRVREFQEAEQLDLGVGHDQES